MLFGIFLLYLDDLHADHDDHQAEFEEPMDVRDGKATFVQHFHSDLFNWFYNLQDIEVIEPSSPRVPVRINGMYAKCLSSEGPLCGIPIASIVFLFVLCSYPKFSSF